MMSLPTKKTVTTNFDALVSRSVIHYGVGHGMSAGPQPPAPKLGAQKPGAGDGDLPKPPRRLVSVDQAAIYAGISRRTMYHWIKDRLVVTGHWPRTNRRYVDLDSVDALLAKSDE